ncbi:MAG: DUF115 domain-containing protein [Treponema sp.]|nr:DUF115 domain-containing protein [Treponema sp.]MCL2251773.1 DUF115 domain-containing protein [Treponema sp.]
MNFFERNKQILLRQYKGLFEELISNNDDDLSLDDIKIEPAASGEYTLCVKGIYAHSQRDPLREGQRLFESVNTEKGPVVILGFGLGYTATAAAISGRSVIVVEKHKKLLLKAMEVRDLSDFLSNNSIMFIVGNSGEAVTAALAIASNTAGSEKKISVIRNKALIGFDEQWYRAVDDRIRAWAMKDEVNSATQKRFAERWVRNLARNMSAIRDYPGVSFLAQKTAAGNGFPVFLAAAGPSLDKIKPLLRDIYERCIIVAVDTSLRFFIQNGIQPDFVVVVDPQFWNNRHLDRCVAKNSGHTALIAESAVYPPVLSLPFKNKFLCGSMFPLGEFIEKKVDQKGKLGAGGSVATTAWDFARSFGSYTQEIWIAGLDLAFPDLKTHFRGARFESLSNSRSGRFNPAEKWIVRALRDAFPFKARSAAGTQVLTDKRLSLYAAWFENQFGKYPQIKNYCFFQEGLAISGLQAAENEKFITLPKCRDEINSFLQSVFNQIESEYNETQEKLKRSERYENAVNNLKSGLETLLNKSVKGAETAKQALKSGLNLNQQDKVFKELEEITRFIKESEVKEIVNFVYASDFSIKDTEGDPFIAYLKSSLELFTKVGEAVHEVLRWL